MAKLNDHFQESRKVNQVFPVSNHKSVFPAYTGNGKIGSGVIAEHTSVIPDVIPPALPEVASEPLEAGGGAHDLLPPVFHCNVVPTSPQQLSTSSQLLQPPLFPPFTSVHSSYSAVPPSCLQVSQDTPPPPPAWSDPPDNHGRDTDSESMPSSTHSSVLVDMGKVVGVLRTYPHEQDLDDLGDENGTVGEEVSDYDLSDDNFVSESPAPTVCATCVQEARGQESEIEDSLFGDPLVYATFVAPVQQYSTETEPSRQPSFNSRQPSFNSRHPSFKQNSSEAEAAVQPEVNRARLFHQRFFRF